MAAVIPKAHKESGKRISLELELTRVATATYVSTQAEREDKQGEPYEAPSSDKQGEYAALVERSTSYGIGGSVAGGCCAAPQT